MRATLLSDYEHWECSTRVERRELEESKEEEEEEEEVENEVDEDPWWIYTYITTHVRGYITVTQVGCLQPYHQREFGQPAS